MKVKRVVSLGGYRKMKVNRVGFLEFGRCERFKRIIKPSRSLLLSHYELVVLNSFGEGLILSIKAEIGLK